MGYIIAMYIHAFTATLKVDIEFIYENIHTIHCSDFYYTCIVKTGLVALLIKLSLGVGFCVFTAKRGYQ